MCVIRRSLSYLSGIISDWVRKPGPGSALKMRKQEEGGIVIQSRDFSSCSLVHHPWGHYCGDDPVPQITKRAFRHQRRRIITLSLQTACSCDHLKVPWWIIHQERGWGPGLKESIKKMQWGREWWPTSGSTMHYRKAGRHYSHVSKCEDLSTWTSRAKKSKKLFNIALELNVCLIILSCP